MAAKKKSGPKKAAKGKTGCLKQNGRLKKGFKWAKGRKGFCSPTAAKKAAKKGAAKKRAPKRKSPTLPKGMDVMDYLDVGGKVRAAYEAKKAGFVNPGAGI
jgi:hypothetical protein